MSGVISIKRGRMTAAEKAEIERLAAALKKPTPAVIARRLNRHPATVAWYMICHGLIERELRYADPRPRTRLDGKVINPYTREQDRRLLELRTAQRGFIEIARVMTTEFGVARNEHSVRIRCIMLAAYAPPTLERRR